MSLTGEPDGPPGKSGLSLVDLSAGFVVALALLVGVHAARRHGVGMDCDVSLFDVAINMLSYLGTWHLTMGFEPARMARSAHPSLVPFQNFPTADGRIVVACPKAKFWRWLTEVMGRPELAADARFADFAARSEHREQLVAILDEVFRTRTTEKWLEDQEPAGVPCAPIRTVRQALSDPQVTAREMIVETEHPRFGTVRSISTRCGSVRGRCGTVGPPD